MDKEQDWHMGEVLKFIQTGGYKIVVLQFPDELLGKSAMIAQRLSSMCMLEGYQIQVFILADSAFDSLSVDEVAATHVKAECIIHYGAASMTPASKTPCYFVFSMANWSGEMCADHVADNLGNWFVENTRAIVLILDHPLQPCEKSFTSRIKKSNVNIEVIVPRRASCSVPPSPDDHENHAPESCAVEGELGFYWSLPNGLSMEECMCIWVGDPASKVLFHLSLKFSSSRWVIVNASNLTSQIGLPSQTSHILRRRHYLVEKARSAQIVGILVSTLAVGGFLNIAKRLKRLANRAGKKTYLVVIGKPSPYKLANFPEVEIFVMICDPPSMILDSKDYLSPIITPYEAQMAFTNSFVGMNEYRYSMKEEDPLMDASGSHFSLVDGSLHHVMQQPETNSDQAIVERNTTNIACVEGVDVRFAADFFSTKRQFKGMDANTSEDALPSVVLGRKGRAAKYSAEGS